LHIGAVELIQNRAHLRYVNSKNGAQDVSLRHQKAIVGRDASIQWTIAAMGVVCPRSIKSVDLVGPGADSQVNGVMFTEGRQHLAYHTLQHHRAPSCHSDFLYKAAQQDKSRTVWRGMIKVDKMLKRPTDTNATITCADWKSRTHGSTTSKVDRHSRADSIPGPLEIEADDVR
jgi:Fe-S cluster assembly protein SufD